MYTDNVKEAVKYVNDEEQVIRLFKQMNKKQQEKMIEKLKEQANVKR